MAKNKVAELTTTDDTTGGFGLTEQLHDSTETPIVQLSSVHRNMLEVDSALSQTVIAARGYYTLHSGNGTVDSLQALGFSYKQARDTAHGDVLVLPIRPPDGTDGLYMIRPNVPRVFDGKKLPDGTHEQRVLKYEQPEGASNRLDVNPACQDQLSDPSVDVWITEGIKKGDALASAGLCAIALPGGVYGFMGKNEKGASTVLSDFGYIGWKNSKTGEPRNVWIVFDSDVMGKDNVRIALKRLTTLLRNKGARVYPVYLPDKPDGSKQGVDDFFAAGGTVETLRVFAENGKLAVQMEQGARPSTKSNGYTPTLSDYLTHGANGRRFVAKHTGQALFNTTFKDWMIYDGSRWVRDEKRAVQTMAKAVVMDLYTLISTIDNEDTRKALAAFARRCDSPTGTDEMMKEAANLLNVSDGGLDTETRYFNVMNGTLDLTTGALLPHDPQHMISKLAPVVYDPSATCPTYDRAIWDIFSGDDDTVRFFEEAVGATLSGRASKNLIFMHGDAGDNGKSTVANLLLKLFGDYGIKGDLSLLVQPDRTDPYRASPTVVSLKGRRFCVVQEVPQGKRMDEQLVKELAGGDMLSARRLHENPIQFWPSHLIWVYGNFRLKIEDQVVFNRLHEIPFKAEFPEGDPRRDDDMPIKLEAELSGILNRFLAGYHRFVANGYRLRPSHRVRVATTSYKTESNSAMRFINERFAIMLDKDGMPNPVYTVPATSLFHDHKAFCIAKDLPPVANKNLFGRTLTKMGIPLDKERVPNRVGLRRLSEAEIADREAREDDEDASNEAEGPRF